MIARKYVLGNSLIWCLSLLLLASCDRNYSSTLTKLREELKQTSDTIYAYSVQNHYALWLHTELSEGPDTPITSLYYYDLKTKQKEKLFTPLRDSLKLMPEGIDFYIDPYYSFEFSQDSCALVIKDRVEKEGRFYVLYYLYPLTGDKNTLYFLGQNQEDIQKALNIYRGKQYVDLSWGVHKLFMRIGGADESWPPEVGVRYIDYNTKGEVVDSMTSVYATYYDPKTDDYKEVEIPGRLLDDQLALVNYVIRSRAYSLEDVYQFAKNEVKFKRMFGGENNEEFFDLYATHLEELEGSDGELFLVKGEGFTVASEHSAFVEDLNFPCHIVIRATVKNINEMLEGLSNPYAAYLYSMFGALEPGLMTYVEHLEGDFLFDDASLVYGY